MLRSTEDLVADLARNAEAVCRAYLSSGRRQGRYWVVGDIDNTPGRSLFVRLHGPPRGKGAAGKWTDAATGEHGDLLDIIARRCGMQQFRDVEREARRFLGQADQDPPVEAAGTRATDSSQAARRLFAMARPITGTLADRYLRHRGITHRRGLTSLRFHPRCTYWPDRHAAAETWPAMVAAVTDGNGTITGVQRTYLDPTGLSACNLGKAPIDTPRRAMGSLFGHGVRFGLAEDVLAAGEGIETVLSIREVMPNLAAVAALSATNLAVLVLPPYLRRLYVLRDADPAGARAAAELAARASIAGIEAITLSPHRKDFNEDLRGPGPQAIRDGMRAQLAPEDAARFLRGNPSVVRG